MTRDGSSLIRAKRRVKEIVVEAETKAMLKFAQYHAPATHLITILALGRALPTIADSSGEMQLNATCSRPLFRPDAVCARTR